MKKYTDNKQFWNTVKPLLAQSGSVQQKVTLVENDDIIALVETHNSDKNDTLSIPGYKRVKVKNRPKTNNSNKNSGGLVTPIKIEGD